jgi:membrane protease YdiL (CAAX protease family)
MANSKAGSIYQGWFLDISRTASRIATNPELAYWNACTPYGITIGPIIEEILFRGAAFSVIYVTAASIKGLLILRLAIAIVFSSLLFAVAHTRTMGIPWLVFFGMGTLYTLLRGRSNSTATAALMHATYNAVIALAMLHA